MDPESLLAQAERLLGRLERWLPQVSTPPDWASLAYRWRRDGRLGYLQPLPRPQRIQLEDLLCLERQKSEIVRNTRQFLARRPANNVLLWGSRGTGKSSLIKALLNEYADAGLRLVEVDKEHLVDLPEIIDPFYDRPESFILFCDDLSFEAEDPSYKSLKAMLDGSLATTPDNVLIYATSNRRHLLPEYLQENQEARLANGEIHHSEGVEEKISLSERFGLWLSFHPFSQEQYLAIVAHWLGRLGIEAEAGEDWRQAALRWALERGSRSGRVAGQFARDWAGRHMSGSI